MILLWGLPGDGPLSDVAVALRELGAHFYFLDQRLTTRTSVAVSLGPPTSGRIMLDGEEVVALELVTGAYLRPYDSREILARAQMADCGAWARASLCDAALLDWADVAPGRVINRPSAMVSNRSKPFQARLIEQAGLRTPETLITTDAHAVERFRDRYGELVYKSIGSTRSIVSRLHDSHRPRMQHLRWCPTQFQRYIPGVDFRVHVLGNDVYAARIDCEADDYRYAQTRGQPLDVQAVELPPEVAAQCCQLSATMGLEFAGIDLRRSPDHHWYCFEVNPSPGFSFYQERTGTPIDRAVANRLLGNP